MLSKSHDTGFYDASSPGLRVSAELPFLRFSTNSALGPGPLSYTPRRPTCPYLPIILMCLQFPSLGLPRLDRFTAARGWPPLVGNTTFELFNLPIAGS